MTLRTRVEKLEKALPGVGDVPTVVRMLVRPGLNGPVECGLLARTLSGVVYQRDEETEKEFKSRIIEETRAGEQNDNL